MPEVIRKDGDPKPGDECFVLERLADPQERFTVIRVAGRGRNAQDQPTTLWLLRTKLGNEIVVEGRQLSQIPPERMYRSWRSDPGGL